MKILRLYFLFLFLSSCDSDKISQIKLEVKSTKLISRSSNDILSPELVINLSSKTDIVKIMKYENSISSYIFCPLKSNNFSAQSISNEKYKLYGFFSMEKEGNFNIQDSSYNFSLSLSFVDKEFDILNQDIVYSLLKDKDCIECKLVVGFFPKRIKKNSFSDSFCIPIEDIVKKDIPE